MFNINYVNGDLFKYVGNSTAPVILPHVCNCRGGFGSGFVVPLQRKYPVVAEKYRSMFPANLGKLGYNQSVVINQNLVIINMVAQELGTKTRPLHYPSLVKCMEEVYEYSINLMTSKTEDNVPMIHAPMFGSGLAKGNWLFIENLIEDIWCAKHLPVTIYYLEGQTPENWVAPNA